MKHPVICYLLFFMIMGARAQDTTNNWLCNHYAKKIATYLDREKALGSFYSMDNKEVKIFASPENKMRNIPEFVLEWQDLPLLQSAFRECSASTLFSIYQSGGVSPEKICSRSSAQPAEQIHSDTAQNLRGKHIAIDPGHIAGDLQTGEMEKKNLKFGCGPGADSIEIAEGMLTYATAFLLKQQLEEKGAIVMLTRPFNGATAFGVTFSDWLKKDFRKAVDSLYNSGRLTLTQKKFFLGPKASDRDKFRIIFKDLELAKRAQVINAFKPDITIIIHYNVDEVNTGWKKPSAKNMNMAFIGGAFMHSDLSTMEKRFEFLRLLFTKDLENSAALSGNVIKAFEDVLKVKTAGFHDAKYLTEGCLPAGPPGVFCRNLQLTRLIHGTLVYGETLFQDNIDECRILTQGKDKTENARVKQVAAAYFQGISNYYNHR